MSYAEKAIDRTPFIPGAGLASKPSQDISLDTVLKQDIYNPTVTSTPDNLKKYRQNLARSVGKKQLHYGIYDDNHDYENLVHGKKLPESDHVYQLIKGPNNDGIKNFINSIDESNYASNKREPLGKSIVRNYKFPDEVKSQNFRFGVPTNNENSVKDLIYNNKCPLFESQKTKDLYYKSHLVTEPGEQSTRFYDWKKPNINPKNHIFGIKQSGEQDGVKKSLMTDNLINPFPQTILVNKREEDFKQATSNLLGKSKYFGTLNTRYANDSNHTYGKTFLNDDTWNVGRCIYGDPKTINTEKVKPDEDLGKNSVLKKKYLAKKLPNLSMDRVYGVPTIRCDLSPPKNNLKSVTDPIDYGDEPDAYDLLYPHPEAIRGVTDDDFDNLYTKDEIFELMKKYDFKIPENEYDLMFDIILKNYPNKEGKVSAKAFISSMRNFKREYQKYRNIFPLKE